MSLALSPAATANTAPPSLPDAVAAAAPVKSGAKAGAKPEAAPAADAAAAEFQRALQRLAQGSAMPAEDADAAALLAGAANSFAAANDAATDDAALDDAHTAQDTTAATMPDLLVSGMLLVPAAPMAPMAPMAPAAPITTSGISPANATAVASTAMPDAATPASTALPASRTAGAPATPPVLPNALAASPAAALAAVPAANRFAPRAPGSEDADASAPSDAPAAPSAAATSVTRQGVNLAALASMATPHGQPGTAHEQRNANAFASADLQNPGIASGIAGATTDSAARNDGLQATPTGSGARGTHSLIEALGERIAQQLQRGSDRAVIRLDPPMQGQLEITIHRDATGATQVHLAASNGDVARQLQTISDSLRQELVNRQSGEVTVLVSQGGREHNGRQGQQQAPQDDPGRALADFGPDSTQGAERFALSSLED